MFFRMSSWVLSLALLAVIVGATALGLWIGRSVRHKAEGLREPFAVMQAALLGFMGLVLAFGLSLAVERYEGRRAAVVEEANAIGTTYLRAQTLPEPVRSSPSRSYGSSTTPVSASPRRSRAAPHNRTPSPRAGRPSASCGRWADKPSRPSRPGAPRDSTSRP